MALETLFSSQYLEVYLSLYVNCWKTANVSPIHKKNNRNDIRNYRPISLLSNISKVFERLIYKPVYEYLTHNKLLIDKNSGFRKGDSTINQLATLTEKILQGLENGSEVRIVFLDASKAFDRVWHEGLLFKMHQLGIQGSLIDWFSSYLCNRKQRVVLNGQSSSWATLQTGVPQGSILGPLLFLIYVSDITENLETDANIFADDTAIADIVSDPLISANKLNSDLSKLQAWVDQWLMQFNPSKTEVLTISVKCNKMNHLPLFLAGTQLTEVQHHKHLGVILSHDLSWTKHICSIVNKAKQRVAIMKRLKYTLHKSTLAKLYKTLVRPILEYGCILFDGCSLSDQRLLESVQYEAARVCTGAFWNTKRESLLEELGWETLHTRRQYFKAIFLFKIKHKLVPSYVSFSLYIISEIQPYSLRRMHHIRVPHAKTSRYANSLLPTSINMWNSLPQKITDSENLKNFKHLVSVHLFPRKPAGQLIIKHNRILSIFHTRLRLGHSSLNGDLCRHGLRDNGQCSCGFHTETALHYFLFCPSYAAQRPKLLETLRSAEHILSNTISSRNLRQDSFKLSLILNGSLNMSLSQNLELFCAVQQYIEETKRFRLH